MALEGNLRDFGLDAIFQLIGNNRNTGVLTLTNKGDQVKVSFIQGQVVWADTHPRRVEDQLGHMLVKSGVLTTDDLQKALELQKQTLQRLGVVLVQHRFVESDDLKAALRTQVLQIVYRLFRWAEGDFKFLQEEEIEYDRENLEPIRSDHILMEGMRMIDEWPQIEKRIPNFKKIFMKAEDVDAMPPALGTVLPKTGGGGLDFSDLAEEKPAGGLHVSREEGLVLARVDGTNTVQDIIDRVPLIEFEVCRVLYDLFDRGLIIEKLDALAPSAGLARSAATEEASPMLVRVVAAFGMLVIAASLVTSHMNPLNTFFFTERYRAVFNEARYGASRNRLEKIDNALKTFYMSYQRFPEDLKYLYARGFVDAATLKDPWGNDYDYTLTEDAYLVMGKTPKGETDPTLRMYYEFSATYSRNEEIPEEEAPDEPQVITLAPPASAAEPPTP